MRKNQGSRIQVRRIKLSENLGSINYCFDRMVEIFHNAFKIFLKLLVASLKEATLGASIDELIM